MKNMSVGPILLVGGALLLVGLALKAGASQNEALYTALAENTADKYGLDRAVVKAIIKKESDWDPNGTNPSDPSYGLMGVTPYIAITFGACRSGDDYATELHKPEKSLEAGCAYLAYLFGKYDDGTEAGWAKIIQCYNEGEPNYDDGYRVPEYLSAVEGFYAEYNSL